ncbi:hypothetical protein [Roseicella aquatilis]|uniref:Uncharacterized protein n=1 Tax=Roseicella aquatilis TaxID=2527868 RepID=A0A4V2WK94_9PROT|nr:hypothetical protein [Roseicella aquatilis]TCZ57251.1 hypothetical protein EXY23_18115 [Roseicella aquatilis]
MDSLDQIFDPAGYRARHAVAAPRPVQPPPPPRPQEAPVRAMEPLPDAAPAAPVPARPAPPETREQRLHRLVRQHRWLTRFWTELTPGQQRRVAQRLGKADPAAGWDVMGLSDRTVLIFGPGVPAPVRERPAAP